MMTGMGFGFGFLGILFMLLFWGVLILGAVWLVRAVFDGGSSRPNATERQSPREILDQRYARGEITREQYELMKQDLH